MEQNGADVAFAGSTGHRVMRGKAGPCLPRLVRAVVFDLDGTLLDTERVYRAAFGETLRGFGLALDDGDYDRLVGLPGTARRALLPALLGQATDTAAFLEAYYANRALLLAPGIVLKPGAAELLDVLDGLGLPAAIATSASATTARAHLAAAGLAGRFVSVVTRDDVARGKPAPDSFLQAARSLGVAPSACLALEDSAHGVAAAHAAGMMVVMIPDLVAPPEESARVCHALAGSLADIAGLLAPPGREPPSGNDRSRSRV